MMLRITSVAALAVLATASCSAPPQSAPEAEPFTDAPVEAGAEVDLDDYEANPIEDCMGIGMMAEANLDDDPEAGDEDEVPADAPPIDATSARAQRSGDVLVWLAGSEDTLRLDTSTGAVIGTEPGIRIAAAGKVWTVQKTTREFPVKTCRELMGDAADPDSVTDDERGEVAPEEPEPGVETRLAFVSGAQSQIAVDFGKDATDFASFQHEVTVAGSVGPYVFLHADTYTFACGAHGGSGAEFIVWDLEHARAVDLAKEMPAEPELATLAEHQMKDEAFEDEHAQLTELLPRLSADGRLVLGRQETVFACYACSDGKWSSYSASARYFRSTLPASLAPHATVPAGLVAFRKTHPEVRVRGFSPLP